MAQDYRQAGRAPGRIWHSALGSLQTEGGRNQSPQSCSSSSEGSSGDAGQAVPFPPPQESSSSRNLSSRGGQGGVRGRGQSWLFSHQFRTRGRKTDSCVGTVTVTVPVLLAPSLCAILKRHAGKRKWPTPSRQGTFLSSATA